MTKRCIAVIEALYHIEKQADITEVSVVQTESPIKGRGKRLELPIKLNCSYAYFFKSVLDLSNMVQIILHRI